MANINDFKLLKKKCQNCFKLACEFVHFDKTVISKLSEIENERFGFYYFILQQVTDLSEYDELTNAIYDTEFNSRLFGINDSDEGVDAIYIDEESKKIYLFNFKYRENFKEDKKQSENEALLSQKFLSVLETETNTLKGKLYNIADELIKKNKSTEIWETFFYIVSNENETIDYKNSAIQRFAEIFGVNVQLIGLNEIVDLMSIRPEKINATMILEQNSVMSFSENELSSNISYIIKLRLTELIRITSTNKQLRDQYNIENEDSLFNTDIDMSVLFDNVRGLILKSKFNKNIENTLNTEPTKFFFFNNGITVVADDIRSDSVNSGKKIKLEVKNFQVLNGGQTLRTIHDYNKKNSNNIKEKLSKAEILIRLLKVTDSSFKNKIGEYTNSQNAIDFIDLKSLRDEQIRLEQFLDEHGILYIRKKGNTGIESKNYSKSIGIQRLGQILLSTILGKPEEISNKKKEIFNSYYDDLFTNNENLISQMTIDYINNYYKIYAEYKKTDYPKTEQRYMYILYISNFLKNTNFMELIDQFEKTLKEYEKKNDADIATSRILISSKFKEELDKKLPAFI